MNADFFAASRFREQQQQQEEEDDDEDEDEDEGEREQQEKVQLLQQQQQRALPLEVKPAVVQSNVEWEQQVALESAAAVQLQASYRGMSARRIEAVKQQSATRIQSVFRGKLDRKSFMADARERAQTQARALVRKESTLGTSNTAEQVAKMHDRAAARGRRASLDFSKVCAPASVPVLFCPLTRFICAHWDLADSFAF